MTENYLSGKKRSLKLGVSGHSENSTSLQTVGGVGIGTTNTDKRALYVVGNTEITGVLTASSYFGDGSGLTGVAATDHVATFDLVVAGISTFHDDVRITGGGINAVGVITGTSFDGAITEWIITSNGSSDYRFTGSGFDGTENDPTIYLVRGQEYNFTNNMGAHPFEIRTAINGSAYNDGITNNGVSNGTLTWDVQMDAPNILYYQCTAHAGMVGKIYIGNSGDSINVGTGGLVISGVTTGINAAGVSSFIQLDVNTGGIDVDGPTELDELNVTGVSTFTSSLKVDGAVDIGTGGLDVDGQTDLDELVVAGVSTFTGNIVAATAEFSGNVTIGGTLTVEDKTNVDSIGLITARTGVRVTAGGIDVTAGVSTFNDTVKFDGAVDIGTGGVDIDGQLDVDELIVAGVSTFSKAIDLNAGIDVDGQADLDEVVVAGVATFSNDVFVGTAITIHAGNVHATGIISAIKFVGDGSQITNLPGINTLGTSNLSDVNVSGTTTTSQLRVSGIGTAEKFFVSTGGLEVDGQTDLDELVVAGVATFSAYPSIDADNEIQVGTAIQLGKAGVITATSFEGSGANLTGIAATDHVSTFDLVVAGISTFNDDVRVLGGGINVVGVSTFNDNVHLLDDDKLLLGGSAGTHDGLEVYHDSDHSYVNDTGTGNLYIGGNQIFINDSSQTKVSAIFNPDTNTQLKYNNSTKFETTAVGATVYGNFKSTTLHVAGISTLTGDVNFVGSLDNVNVTGAALTTINVKAIGGNYTGVVTASSFSGSGANLTSLNAANLGSGTIPDARFPAVLPAISGVNLTNLPTGINTANDSTFKDLSITGLKVAGVSTFNSAVDINAVVDIDGQLDVDELIASGVSTFSGYLNAASRLYFDMGTGTKYMFGSGADLLTSISSEGDWKLTLNASGGTGGDFIVEKSSGTSLLEAKGTGAVDINGTLNATGISSFTSYPSIDADNEIQVGTAIQLGKAGVVTATTFSGALSGNATSATTATNVTVADESSDTSCNVLFVTAATGDLAPKSGTNLTFNSDTGALSATSFSGDGSNLTGIGTQGPDGAFFGITVSGVSTFHDDVRITGGGINAVGVITATSFSGDGSQLSGVGTQGINIQARSLVVSGVSTFYDDVKIVGGGSTAGNQITIGATTLNDGTLTFDGSAGQLFSITNNLTDGSIFSVNDVSGMPSIDVGAAGTIQLAPHGAGELVGIGTTRPTSKLDVVGDVQVVGVVTATSFSGDGSALTNVPGATDGSFIGLNVTGITTLGDDVRITAGGLNVASGIVSATQLDIGTGGIDVDGQTDLDEVVVAGVSTFSGKAVFNTAYPSIDADNEIQVGTAIQLGKAGVVTATSFVGDGSALTNLPASTSDKIEEGNTKAEVSDSGGDGKFFVETEGTERFSIDSSGDFIFNSCNDSYFNATGNLTIDYKMSDSTKIRNFTKSAAFYFYPMSDSYPFVVGSQYNEQNHMFYRTGEATIGTGITLSGGTGNIIATGIMTAASFSGDGSALTNLPASASTGEFYVGFTSSVTMNAASYETTGHTFPSTESKTYTIESIMASNIANVGVGTTVNLIASISSNSGVAAGTTEQTYFAYNIPIAAGGAVELIKEPFVANPNDIVKLWATDSTYTGISSAIQVHMTYTQQDSTDFFGKYAANTSIGSTTIIGIHTAGPTYAAALQSIHITNRSDAGAFPVDILLTDSTGIVTTYLVKNLVIPKYSAVEILERPKRMETGSSLGVKVQQTGTIDVIVSGKTYS